MPSLVPVACGRADTGEKEEKERGEGEERARLFKILSGAGREREREEREMDRADFLFSHTLSSFVREERLYYKISPLHFFRPCYQKSRQLWSFKSVAGRKKNLELPTTTVCVCPNKLLPLRSGRSGENLFLFRFAPWEFVPGAKKGGRLLHFASLPYSSSLQSTLFHIKEGGVLVLTIT